MKTSDVRPKRLLGEFVLLYLIAPGALSLLSRERRWIVLAAISAGSIFSLILLLADRSYPRAALLKLPAPRQAAGALLRAAAAAAILFAALRFSGHWPAFVLPREHPQVWIALLATYPLLSALPQEVMYRALFFHRYRALFRSEGSLALASALAFGWAHVLVHNLLAVGLATLAGALLSWTYLRSRSLLLGGLEHSLYGQVVLTAGVGGMFVNGVRILSAVLH